MKLSDQVFKNDERALYELRALYSAYGYTRYKVSKFEEYDLYAHNKSFLISEHILTFTDTNGKLMALKPDVTLSIVKNIGTNDRSTHKLYYNETVYRTSPASDGFREIMQTGLECIGRIDLYATSEVLMLAERSLALISDRYILDVSHMGFLTGLLENVGVGNEDITTLLSYIGNKNIGAIAAFCNAHGIDASAQEQILRVTALYAPLGEALEAVRDLVKGEKMTEAYSELSSLALMMRLSGSDRSLCLDFSMVHDMRYYDGLIFRGFVEGVPDSLLSGGRYDRLLEKMGKRVGAIGFAVYLDRLERLNTEPETYDCDLLISYDEDVDAERVLEAVSLQREAGKTVRVQSGDVTDRRCRLHLHLKKDGGCLIDD